MSIDNIFSFFGKENIVKTVRNFFQSIHKFFVGFDIDMNAYKMLLIWYTKLLHNTNRYYTYKNGKKNLITLMLIFRHGNNKLYLSWGRHIDLISRSTWPNLEWTAMALSVL